MSIANLDVKGTTPKFSAALVVELHPSPVLVKARAFPLQSVVRGRGSAHEGGQEVHRAVKRVDDRPRGLSGQQREHIPWVKWQFRFKWKYSDHEQEEHRKQRWGGSHGGVGERERER